MISKALFFLAIATGLSFGSSSFAATQTPTSVKMKIYEFWLSTSPLCTNPVKVYSPATAAYQNIGVGSTPTLGTGAIAPGTYNCVILVFSDMIKSTASATSGTCSSGTEYTKGVCKDGDLSTNLDGSITSCTTAGDDRMTVYFSTASGTGGAQNSLAPPTTNSGHDTNGEKLQSPLVISASGSGTAVFDVTNGLDDATSSCSLENISFGFRN